MYALYQGQLTSHAQICQKKKLKLSWRLPRGVEVWLHSFLTSTFHGDKRSTSWPGCFNRNTVYGRLRLKCDGTCAETRFRLSGGRFHLNRRGCQFSRLLTAEVCASAVVMLDTPCSEVVRRVLATHSIHQFPLHFPSRASPCAITFQLHSTHWKGSRAGCSLLTTPTTLLPLPDLVRRDSKTGATGTIFSHNVWSSACHS